MEGAQREELQTLLVACPAFVQRVIAWNQTKSPGGIFKFKPYKLTKLNLIKRLDAFFKQPLSSAREEGHCLTFMSDKKQDVKLTKGAFISGHKHMKHMENSLKLVQTLTNNWSKNKIFLKRKL